MNWVQEMRRTLEAIVPHVGNPTEGRNAGNKTEYKAPALAKAKAQHLQRLI